MKRIAVIAAIVILSAGCVEKSKEPWRDAPTTDERNDDPATVIEMPDGFSNLATKCDHGNRVYVIYKGDKAYGGVAVIPADPSCGRAAE